LNLPYPVGYALSPWGDLVAFHDLETPAEIRADPASHKGQSVGALAPLLAKAAIRRLRVLIAEILDHHEQHGRPK
jgi:hypothetical protein